MMLALEIALWLLILPPILGLLLWLLMAAVVVPLSLLGKFFDLFRGAK